MTILTIEIPDNESSIIAVITEITPKAGLKVSIDADDEGLSEEEFKKIEDACKEIILIKKGSSKAIAASELWDE